MIKLLRIKGVINMRSGVLKGARKIELEKRDNLIGRPGYILIDVLKL